MIMNNKQLYEKIMTSLAIEVKNLIENCDFNSVKNDDGSQQFKTTLYNTVTEFVDLGLPSGTLWHKYNLGVDPKNLKTSDDWCGNWYSWGEIKPNKPAYAESRYKFYCSDTTMWSKKYNKYDGLKELELKDDAAYQSNNMLKIPTQKQYEELIKHTICKPVQDYKGVLGLNGAVLISKYNGAELFFPSDASWSRRQNKCFPGNYWTSSSPRGVKKNDKYDGARRATAFYIYENTEPTLSEGELRYEGIWIRPVKIK